MLILDIVIISGGPGGLFLIFLHAKSVKNYLCEASSNIGGKLTLYLQKIIFNLPSYKHIKAKTLFKI